MEGQVTISVEDFRMYEAILMKEESRKEKFDALHKEYKGLVNAIKNAFPMRPEKVILTDSIEVKYDIIFETSHEKLNVLAEHVWNLDKQNLRVENYRVRIGR